MKDYIKCEKCGAKIERYINPVPTADLILMDRHRSGLYLVERGNSPHGWALPGGFIEYGEDPRNAAEREGREETGLAIEMLSQFRAFGSPGRDPRHHTITIVFDAIGSGAPVAGDDAKNVCFFNWKEIPELAFDHGVIVEEYRKEMGTS